MAGIGHVSATMRTDRGQVRDHNEDFVACYEPAGHDEVEKNGWLYILADGVGGADAGEVASRYATERTLHHYLADESTVDRGKRLSAAMQAANTDLRELIAIQGAGSRMATTMVAAAIEDDKVTIANVGDSRGYLWRSDTLSQVTKDQSLVARLVEEGAITEEEAADHPRRNVILHSLGSEKRPQIDVYVLPLTAGERLLLCSDGLTRHVSDEEIAESIRKYEPAQATAELIQLANDRGGEDNISVAILSFGEPSAQPESKTRPGRKQVTKTVSRAGSTRARRALWLYTAILCLIQTIIITLLWFLIAA
jgi:serine/threonine protein phosphatase PrpC